MVCLEPIPLYLAHTIHLVIRIPIVTWHGVELLAQFVHVQLRQEVEHRYSSLQIVATLAIGVLLLGFVLEVLDRPCLVSLPCPAVCTPTIEGVTAGVLGEHVEN